MTANGDRPNLLLVMADNLGAWALGCDGNDEIRTPNLDRLAAEGVRCDRAFCVNPVCSPNRATALTGLMPAQHGVHSYLSKERPSAEMGPGAYCTIDEFLNLPRLLADAGYDCGHAGKWHLGDNARPQCGFRFWRTMTAGHTADFCRTSYVRDGEVSVIDRYYPEQTTDDAIEFLRQPRDAPFFGYIAYNAPYGLDHDLIDRGHPRPSERDPRRPLHCCPEGPAHPWLTTRRREFKSRYSRPGFADAVESLDREVGRLLAAIDELAMRERTIVLFTADHGICAGHNGLWGMSDHGWPRPFVQANLRIPLIVRGPGLPAGVVVDASVANDDLLPTLAELMELQLEDEARTMMPGRSVLSAWRGAEPADPDRPLYQEYELLRCVQDRQWKLIHRHADLPGGDALYDLAGDPGEYVNRIDDPACRAVRDRLRSRLDAHFTRYCCGATDPWQGGEPKSGPAAREVS